MRYPNARLGIKILYHEAIASMIFALVSLIEIVCAIFDTAEVIDKIVHVLVIIALILSLVDTILKIFGILKAAFDMHPNCWTTRRCIFLWKRKDKSLNDIVLNSSYPL